MLGTFLNLSEVLTSGHTLAFLCVLRSPFSLRIVYLKIIQIWETRDESFVFQCSRPWALCFLSKFRLQTEHSLLSPVPLSCHPLSYVVKSTQVALSKFSLEIYLAVTDIFFLSQDTVNFMFTRCSFCT